MKRMKTMPETWSVDDLELHCIFKRLFSQYYSKTDVNQIYGQIRVQPEPDYHVEKWKGTRFLFPVNWKPNDF